MLPRGNRAPIRGLLVMYRAALAGAGKALQPEARPMPNGTTGLNGLRVLVVEDNFLLADLIADTLRRFGCEVVGPAGDVAMAVKLARESELDGAVLDLNLFGEFCFPVAEALAERAVPYLFLTGYDTKHVIPPEFRSIRRLSKPVDPKSLSAAAEQCFRRQPAH